MLTLSDFNENFRINAFWPSKTNPKSVWRFKIRVAREKLSKLKTHNLQKFLKNTSETQFP
jgi:hypothetical protein